MVNTAKSSRGIKEKGLFGRDLYWFMLDFVIKPGQLVGWKEKSGEKEKRSTCEDKGEEAEAVLLNDVSIFVL